MYMLNKSLILKSESVNNIAVLEPFPCVSKVLMDVFLNIPEVEHIIDVRHFETLQKIVDEREINMVFMDLIDIHNDPGAGLSFITKNATLWQHTDLVIFTSTINAYAIDFVREVGSTAIICKREKLESIKNKIKILFSRNSFSYPREWGPLKEKADIALTRRESDILYFLSHGISMREASSILGISYKTVHSHKSNIMNKLGARGLFDLHKAMRSLKSRPEK
ncbi:helix-turn-helix transcriptional regulator [Serratia entomophila]|uniref:helix-turn-helix transcriptional regulator n=1 Tax=Serratia entomophila TaxID=42906 RepID=UPI00217728C7|nr:LuxR C-terminal-related transcriptional regulator [Serratia entomophila]CAI0821735.1 Transcriptional regulatory protein uhpA [Serratia entomophila]CAI1541402.1 Transcriptional regulatory protein uhpA [Serratia entomophila]CAI1550336.1 Transcriptional regulatory protein uhpA [Serratia entomophila]CAI1634839.1 Transcriptional regulatory protein uhpA [Serratia entomophila]CAI1663476.1 Transcriptional regulatory protein uhpA [Serratia entomophila]